ncbi:MAG TPA: type II secretion system protein [Candidatus Omnitrophota bacterium]|nr:type II secretion system protein [Candidatus Omnitrophota bacterium]
MKKEIGFTLLEIMVSMVVLTVVAVGVIGTVAFTKRSAAEMQQRLSAIDLAEKKIAEIKTQKIGAIPLTHETITTAFSELSSAVMAYKVEKLGVPYLFNVEIEIRWDYGWRDKANPCATNWDSCDKKMILRTVYFSPS